MVRINPETLRTIHDWIGLFDITGGDARTLISSLMLLEIWGPLFMSTAATSNLLYRLSETDDGTLITFTHTLVGPFPEDHRPQPRKRPRLGKDT